MALKKLPKELEHLDRYKKYAKRLKKGVYGFFIDQFKENGAKNPDWYEFRINTIGASETSTLFGMNEFKPLSKLFWEKIGKTYPAINTKFTFWGLEHEASTAKAWKYFDGTDEGYLQNKMEGKIIRHNEDLNCYVVNVKYPWLSVSLDSLAKGGQESPFEKGRIIENDFPLEIKQISAFAAAKYRDGFPVGYIYQLHQQMLVFESDYAELAYLTAGTDFNVVPFDRQEGICELIKEESEAFWKELVIPGKELYKKAQLELDEEKRKVYLEQLDELEPPPDDTKAYEDFWEEKYLNTNEVKRIGNQDEFEVAVKYQECNDKIKELTKEKQKYKNELLYMMRDDEELDFGEYGRVVHRVVPDKRKQFTVKVKG